MSINGKRLYVGRLSRDATRRDVEDFFAKAGPLIDVRVMQGFGFVEFESPRDAEEAVATLSGRDLLGEAITLDYARDTRGMRREDPYGAPRGFGGPPGYGGGGGGGSRAPPREGRGRLLIQELPRDVSWQDLKDFGREGGPVSYADLDRDVPGQGIIEYPSVPDAEDAAKRLEGLQIRGAPVVVVLESNRFGGGGGGGYPPPPRDADPYGRRDDRGYDRRDDYRRDDRDYGRRDDYYDYRAPPPRRDERDYRRDDRDYRPREDYPPRRDEPRRDEPRRDEPRRDYDDRRPAAYDQRRERSPPPRQRSRSPAPAGGDAPREAAPVRDEDRAQEASYSSSSYSSYPPELAPAYSPRTRRSRYGEDDGEAEDDPKLAAWS